ncbi:MAG TPA: alpha/beta hydrolase [Methanoregulaceae archaeon]|nr:alpha/beta hydrolase [Methanoregulaceae archaeon]
MFHPLDDGYLLFEGSSSFLVVARALRRQPLCIETVEGEVVQGLDPDDLIAASAPNGGPLAPALMLIELVRRYGFPLVVLPKGHPGSRRLGVVVSAGPAIRIACGIQRGTHPEQDVLCGADELAGLVLRGVHGGVEIEGGPPGLAIRSLPCLSVEV